MKAYAYQVALITIGMVALAAAVAASAQQPPPPPQPQYCQTYFLPNGKMITCCTVGTITQCF